MAEPFDFCETRSRFYRKAARRSVTSQLPFSPPTHAELRSKYHGRAFRVATLDGWVVVLSGSDLVEELRRRPDDEFSFKEGAMSVRA